MDLFSRCVVPLMQVRILRITRVLRVHRLLSRTDAGKTREALYFRLWECIRMTQQLL